MSAFSRGATIHRISVWSDIRVYREDVLRGKCDVTKLLGLGVFACMCVFSFDMLRHVSQCPLENHAAADDNCIGFFFFS